MLEIDPCCILHVLEEKPHIFVYLVRMGVEQPSENFTVTLNQKIYPLWIAAGFDVPQWAANELNRFQRYMKNRFQRYMKNVSSADIEKTAFIAIRKRATEVCIALQELELDANRLMKIVFYDCLPFSNQVAKHHLWELVTKVKHFRTK